MAPAPQILQGSWEDVAAHADEFRGRQVTLIVAAEYPAGVPVPIAVDAENAAAIAYLHQRLRDAPTSSDAIRRAEDELEELHTSLNANRLEAGERPLFPE
jgi:hypothetical protein